MNSLSGQPGQGPNTGNNQLSSSSNRNSGDTGGQAQQTDTAGSQTNMLDTVNIRAKAPPEMTFNETIQLTAPEPPGLMNPNGVEEVTVPESGSDGGTLLDSMAGYVTSTDNNEFVKQYSTEPVLTDIPLDRRGVFTVASSKANINVSLKQIYIPNQSGYGISHYEWKLKVSASIKTNMDMAGGKILTGGKVILNINGNQIKKSLSNASEDVVTEGRYVGSTSFTITENSPKNIQLDIQLGINLKKESGSTRGIYGRELI